MRDSNDTKWVPDAVKRAARAGARAFGSASSSRRMLPDLLIIGTQRGGTTSLYNHLIGHPQIAGALLDKEVHYFDKHFRRGQDWYRSHFPTRGHATRVERRTGGSFHVCESSPYYMFDPRVPERAAAAIPDARLIALLRDPIERAWSQYRHEVDLGFETLSFEEALERELDRLAGELEKMLADPAYVSFSHQHYSYVARGEYAEQIQGWLRYYPADRLLVIRSEDFYAEPGRIFQEVTAFLGVKTWTPLGFPRYNAATSTGMAPETRAELESHFREANARLEQLLGRSFGWAR